MVRSRRARVTIVNSPPSASVALSPINPMVGSTLTATVTSSDADNDPLTYTYVWEQNGTVVQTTADTSSTTDTLDLADLTGVNPDDTITVDVLPNDGTTDGAMATAAVVVESTAPVATVNLAPINPMTNQILTATATAFDPNGNPVTLTYVWTVNGVVVQTTTDTTALTDTLDLSVPGNGDTGDVVAVTVTPSNGVIDGAPVTSSTTVVNTPPTVVSHPQPG